MSMAYVAVALTVVSAAVSATAAIQQGQAQKNAAEYNAKVQEQAAHDALQRGSDEAAANQDRTRRLIATQRAGFGASGLDISSGSPLDILTETAGLGKLDSLRLINNAQREGQGLMAQSEITKYQGDQAQTAGYMNAAATILGSASNGYFGYKKATGG